jgi:hypothetical protein
VCLKWRTRHYHRSSDRVLLLHFQNFTMLDRRPRTRGWIPGRGRRLFSAVFVPSLRTNQSPIQWASGSLSHGIRLQEREADHSPPSNTVTLSMLGAPPCLHGMVRNLVQEQRFLSLSLPHENECFMHYFYIFCNIIKQISHNLKCIIKST